MNNDAFIAFWVGAGAGLIFGIFISAVITAVSNTIEGGKNND